MTESESTKLEFANRKLSRRTVFLGGIQLALVSVLAGRLIYLQGFAAEGYRDLAEANRVNIQLTAPSRGIITDRNGIVLARNSSDYTVTIVQEQARDIEETLRRISLIIPLPDEQIGKILEDVGNQRPFIPVLVADQLSWEQFARLSVNLPVLPGAICSAGQKRFYPFGDSFAHVIGYVGRVSQEDLSDPEDKDPILHHPNFGKGKAGVEGRMDKALRGASGHKMLEVNAAGRVIRELERNPATAGSSMEMTLDSELQNYVIGRMGDEAGVCVVLDLVTSDILALVSTPSFDPNKFSTGISQREYDQYLDDPRTPLFNRATSGTYPPGSTFKMMASFAGLESGKLQPDTEFFCNGHYELFNQRFHCWNRGGHGHVSLKEALSESCDVFFYQLAEQLGIEPIAEMSSKFGFGRRADLPLTSLVDGLIPDSEWKRKTLGETWHVGDTLNASIGQGFVSATCMQIAVMAARIALGREFRPRLIRSVDGQEQGVPTFQPLDVMEDSLQLVRQGMHDVVNTSTGTAFKSRCVDEQFIISGKTGTSQVTRLREDIKEEDLPREHRDHALFCAFAPHDAPRYAVAVIVEHGGSGSRAAAPIARDALMYAYYGSEPPLHAYPAVVREEILGLKEIEEEIEIEDFWESL